jgi:hypothetical protein
MMSNWRRRLSMLAATALSVTGLGVAAAAAPTNQTRGETRREEV